MKNSKVAIPEWIKFQDEDKQIDIEDPQLFMQLPSALKSVIMEFLPMSVFEQIYEILDTQDYHLVFKQKCKQIHFESYMHFYFDLDAERYHQISRMEYKDIYITCKFLQNNHCGVLVDHIAFSSIKADITKNAIDMLIFHEFEIKIPVYLHRTCMIRSYLHNLGSFEITEIPIEYLKGFYTIVYDSATKYHKISYVHQMLPLMIISVFYGFEMAEGKPSDEFSNLVFQCDKHFPTAELKIRKYFAKIMMVLFIEYDDKNHQRDVFDEFLKLSAPNSFKYLYEAQQKVLLKLEK